MDDIFNDGVLNFNTEDSNGHDIIGDPADSMQEWHQQANDDTCAIVSQEFVLDELTGQDFSEEQLKQEAADNGWYTEGGGTPMDDVGNIIEEHGFEVEKTTGNSVEDIADKLEHGDKVIIGVDANELWSNDQTNSDSHFESNFFGINEHGANHAVEVIGIDETNKDNPMVILNDPGHPDGMGMEVPEDKFIEAWDASNDFMVNTTGHMYDGTLHDDSSYHDSLHHDSMNDNNGEPSFGGYYNNDGTYHWESDNTNTDDHGNIVSYDN
jgi:hypothetical protein